MKAPVSIADEQPAGDEGGCASHCPTQLYLPSNPPVGTIHRIKTAIFGAYPNPPPGQYRRTLDPCPRVERPQHLPVTFSKCPEPSILKSHEDCVVP